MISVVAKRRCARRVTCPRPPFAGPFGARSVRFENCVSDGGPPGGGWTGVRSLFLGGLREPCEPRQVVSRAAEGRLEPCAGGSPRRETIGWRVGLVGWSGRVAKAA